MNDASKLVTLAAGIRSGGKQREQALSHLYNATGLYPKIRQMVIQHGGNDEDARDIYHEGIITLDRKIREDNYEDQGSLEGYLFGICRFLWANQHRKNLKIDLKEDFTPYDRAAVENPLDSLVSAEGQLLLDSLFQSLGENCSKILSMCKLSFSMNEIAEELGLPSGDNARKHKFRCYQKLLQIVENSSSLAENLKSINL